MKFQSLYLALIVMAPLSGGAAEGASVMPEDKQIVALSNQRTEEMARAYKRLSESGFRGESVIQWRYELSKCIADVCGASLTEERKDLLAILARNSPSALVEIGPVRSDGVASIMTILLNVSGYLSANPSALSADDVFLIAVSSLNGITSLDALVIPNYTPVAIPKALPEPPGVAFGSPGTGIDQISDPKIKEQYQQHQAATRRAIEENSLQRVLQANLPQIRQNVLQFVENSERTLRLCADKSSDVKDRERYYGYATTLHFMLGQKHK